MTLKRIKIIAVIVGGAVVVGSMCFLAWLNARYFERALIEQTQQHLSNIAKLEAQSIETLFHDTQDALQTLAADLRVQDAILNDRSLKDETGSYRGSPIETVLMESAPKIKNVYRLDEHGIVQNRVPYDIRRIGANYSMKPGVRVVLETHQPAISNVFEANSGRKCISICYPVFNDQRFIGVMRTIIYAEDINELVGHVEVGKNGYSWVIDHSGTVVSHKDKTLIGQNILDVASSKGGIEQAEAEVISAMISGTKGAASFVFDEFSQEHGVMAWFPIRISDDKTWSIAVCMDYREISGPITIHARNIFIAIGLFAGIAVTAGIVYYRLDKKKVQIEAHMAVSRVNEELQHVFSEREQTAAELREQGELLSRIITAIPYGIFWKDRDSVYQGCNKSFAELAGVDHYKDVIGKTDHDLPWTKEQADFSVHCDQEVIKTGIPLLNVKQSLQNSQGHDVTISISKVPLRDETGGINGILGVYTEDSELKKNGHDLQLEAIECSDVLSSINEAIVVAGAAGMILSANRCFTELIGKTEDDIIGEVAYKYIPGSAGDAVKQAIKDFKKQSAPKPVTVLQLINQRQFQVRVQPIFREDAYSGVVINVVDLSKIAELKDQTHQDSPAHLEKSAKEDPHPPTDATGQNQTDEVPLKNNANSHILVVDDVQENRMLIDVLLKKADYQTTLCCDGKEAVQLSQNQRFDLILMDIQMSEMDGFQATKIIRSEGLNTITPIIAMTANNDERDELACLAAGCDDYLPKPIEKEKVMSKVWRFVQQSKQIKTAEAGGDITSFLIDSPDYQKTIDTFLDNLPGRINEMQECFNQGNLQELALKVHALKGLGGFAGFPIYTEKAKQIEQLIHDDSVDGVKAQLQELAQLCSRTSSGR